MRHNGQISVHTMVVALIVNIYGHRGKEERDGKFEPFYASKSEKGHVLSP